MFFADLITFSIPAITHTKKNVKINHGLVPNHVSKINPIILPTSTAATSSVLILKATPSKDVFLSLFFESLSEIFFLQFLGEF